MSTNGRLIHTIYDAESTPYMTRVVVGHARLHIFHRGDSDPDPHDHPSDFWTFPLTSYVEEVFTQDGQRVPKLVRAFRLHFRPAEYTHRVVGKWSGHHRRHPQQTAEDLVVPGRIVTLVWFGPKRRDWGFHVRRAGKACWIAWRHYVDGGGKTAACA